MSDHAGPEKGKENPMILDRPRLGQPVKVSWVGTFVSFDGRGDGGAYVEIDGEITCFPPSAVLEVLPDPEPAEITRLRGWTVWGPAAFANAVDAVAALVARLQQEAQHGRLV